MQEELAHVHDPDEAHPTAWNASHSLADMEAESLAYVVCSAAGLASAVYSLPHLAR